MMLVAFVTYSVRLDCESLVRAYFVPLFVLHIYVVPTFLYESNLEVLKLMQESFWW